jgi:hypothetical protein
MEKATRSKRYRMRGPIGCGFGTGKTQVGKEKRRQGARWKALGIRKKSPFLTPNA